MDLAVELESGGPEVALTVWHMWRSGGRGGEVRGGTTAPLALAGCRGRFAPGSREVNFFNFLLLSFCLPGWGIDVPGRQNRNSSPNEGLYHRTGTISKGNSTKMGRKAVFIYPKPSCRSESYLVRQRLDLSARQPGLQVLGFGILYSWYQVHDVLLFTVRLTNADKIRFCPILSVLPPRPRSNVGLQIALTIHVAR